MIRARGAARLRASGMKWREVGDAMGVGAARAKELAKRWERDEMGRDRRAPVTGLSGLGEITISRVVGAIEPEASTDDRLLAWCPTLRPPYDWKAEPIRGFPTGRVRNGRIVLRDEDGSEFLGPEI